MKLTRHSRFILALAVVAMLGCSGGGSPSSTSNPPPQNPAPTTIPGVFRANQATQAATTRGLPSSAGGTVTINMGTPRVYHSAVKMTNGDLMIIGGDTYGTGAFPVASTEIFHAEHEGFSPAGDMTTPRVLASAARLSDGRIVVLGGVASIVADPFAIDVYDHGVWSKAPCTEINQRDAFPCPGAAFGLPKGKLLYYGGASWAPILPAPIPIEFHNPRLIDTTKTPWEVKTLSTDPIHHRTNFASLTLHDGRVLITGGGTEINTGDNAVILFDPKTETFRFGRMASSRIRHGMVQHVDGKVQLYGGLGAWNQNVGTYTHETSVETYDPDTNTSSKVGDLRQGLAMMGSNLLQHGETLHGGGPDKDGHASTQQITYNYKTNISLFSTQMLTPRNYFVSVALNNGRVAYIGGMTTSTVLSSAEIFDSYSAIMINTPSDSLKLGQSMQVDLVSGGSVDWSCTKNVGEISGTGLYKAPAPVDPASGNEDPTFVILTATSKADPQNKVSVTLSLVP